MFDNNFDLSVEAIHAAIASAAHETTYDYTPSRREVEDTSNGKFDPVNYWAMTIAGKNSKIDKFKAEEIKYNATMRLYSKVASLNNKNYSPAEIAASLSDSVELMGLGGKRPVKLIERIVSNLNMLDYRNHTEGSFFNLINTVAILSKSRKIQKDTKLAMPILFLLTALTQARYSTSDAIMSTIYTTKLGFSITRTDEAILALLHEGNQKRKWLAYEKVGAVKFTPGKKGGNSNKVALLKNEEKLDVEAKLKAVELILNYLEDSDFKTALAALLTYVANAQTHTYEDCTLNNLIDDVLKLFRPIADNVINTRKAERLVESVEFEVALEEEQAAIKARVDAHLSSGRGFQAKMHKTSSVAVMEPEVAVEAPESHVDELINTIPTPARVAVIEPQIKLQPFTPEWYIQREKDNHTRFLNDPKLAAMEW